MPCGRPPHGKKGIGLVFHAHLADSSTEADKQLAAESVLRERRSTLKFQEKEKLCSQAINVSHCQD